MKMRGKEQFIERNRRRVAFLYKGNDNEKIDYKKEWNR